jgi:hypothetical protein
VSGLTSDLAATHPIGDAEIKQFAKVATTPHYAVLEGDGQFQFVDIQSLKVAKTVDKAVKGI